jgi:hypothetical protein
MLAGMIKNVNGILKENTFKMPPQGIPRYWVKIMVVRRYAGFEDGK